MSDVSDTHLRVSKPGAPPDVACSRWEGVDERTLVGACLEGEAGAFDVIVKRHQRQVYLLCHRFMSNHEDASDLAQDVFIRAFRGLHGFRSGASLTTWLYRIAVNVSLNRLALKTPVVEAIDRREHVDARAEMPDVALLRAEQSSVVRAAIARLPRKQRATLILRVYHDLSHQEIAEILGSSVGAVKTNFFHALTNLRKLLA